MTAPALLAPRVRLTTPQNQWRQLVLLTVLSCHIPPSAVTFAQQRNQEKKVSRTFPTIPRGISQRLERLRAPVQEQSFSDAATLLGEIFQELDEQDYFVLDDASRLARGFRSELLQVVGSLNPTIIEKFEQRYGAEAKQMLEEALETRDNQKLLQCAQKWILTDAGQQACLTLGRLEFDRNRPERAIRLLSRMPNSVRVEPERSILLARAYAQSGLAVEESLVWDRLKQQHPDATLRLGDNELRIFQDGQLNSELATLARVSRPSASLNGEGSGDSRPPRSNWLVHRGGTARTAAVPMHNPAAKPHWEQRLVAEKSEASREIDRVRNLFAEADFSVAPVVSPLATGEQILARGLNAIHGINLKSGEMMWSYPSKTVQRRVPDTDAERLWKDASFGRISSDGKRAFFIDQWEAVEEDPDQIALRARVLLFAGNVKSMPMPYRNQLVALDLQRKGAFAWIAGGIRGESEPKLAEATFFGPPLPVDDELYVVAEIKDHVVLVALSPLTGRMQWSQSIAQFESKSLSNDSSRRYGGAGVAYADGILVCPNMIDSVIAIDVWTRQLLWGYQIREPAKEFDSAQLAAAGILRSVRSWTDCDIMIAGSKVIATDSQELICLDLANGQRRWNRRRNDTMYVAVTGEDRLLLIGEHRFAAVRITDGGYAWSRSAYIAIPGGGSPAGRGLFDGKYFYLPTTDREIVQIDVADGNIIERRKLDEPAGNLIVHGNALISQNECKLAAWLPVESTLEPNRTAHTGAIDVVSLEPSKLYEFLGNEDFAVREHAAQELLRRHADALPELAKGIRSTDAEVAYRCTSILIHLLDFPDAQTSSRARAILQAASNAPTPFAANAYARESYWRANGAIAELQRLGGLVRDNGKTVTLAVNWRGGNDGLAQLVWLPNLESLELCHSGIDDSGLAYVRGLSQLKSLNLRRSAITSRGLAHLDRSSQLETLMLQGTQIDDSALQHLAKITQLKSVNLRNTNLSATGIEQLERQLPKVKVLR